MQKFLFILTFLTFLCSVHAQEEALSKREMRKIARQMKREQEKEINDLKITRVYNLLESRKFVLEADYLSSLGTSKTPVNSTLNFILLDSTEAVVQVGSHDHIGYNGLGGITLEGYVRDYEVSKTNNSKAVKVSLVLSGMGSSYDVFISVNPDGNATASITGYTGGNIMFHGRVMTKKESFIDKGMPF